MSFVFYLTKPLIPWPVEAPRFLSRSGLGFPHGRRARLKNEIVCVKRPALPACSGRGHLVASGKQVSSALGLLGQHGGHEREPPAAADRASGGPCPGLLLLLRCCPGYPCASHIDQDIKLTTSLTFQANELIQTSQHAESTK